MKTARFEECDSAAPEDGYEKFVILHKGGLFKHIACIVNADTWRGKLGEYEDLDHPATGMKGGAYGKVYKYLRRSVAYAAPSLPDVYRL